MTLNIPTLDAVKALDGRIFAMLDQEELDVLDFYRKQGRKYDVAVSILNEADPIKLARATSAKHADDIMKSANSKIKIMIGKEAEASWAARNK